MTQLARRTSVDAFWAIPEHERFHEWLNGEIVPKAAPSGEHADAQGGLLVAIRAPFQRAPGRGGPGGWWILSEVETWLETGEIVRPDVVGWRRERCPQRPVGMPVRIQPDWVCEIVSPSNASRDRVKKLQLYHRLGIPHYWLVDPQEASLTVMRWTAAGYMTVLAAERDEIVRAEPFDAIELLLGTLFGDDPP